MGLYRAIAAALERGEPVGLASVLEVLGSAPAPAGSRLALFADGSRAGTIGGGSPEKEAIEALKGGAEGIREVALGADEQEGGLLCGGRVRILLEQLGKESAAVFAALGAALDRGESAALAVVLVDGRARGRKVLAGRSEVPEGPHPLDGAIAETSVSGEPSRLVLAAGGEACAEIVLPVPRLIVVGGGHVGKAAAEVAAAAGWRTAVVDDRPDYVAASRFPTAEERIEARPAAGIAALAPGPADAVLVATRSAALDLEGVIAAAPSPAYYVGLLASRRKWESFRAEVVAAAGEEAAARVRAPVGLKIGARGPGEIAVAVVAEALSAWRGR